MASDVELASQFFEIVAKIDEKLKHCEVVQDKKHSLEELVKSLVGGELKGQFSTFDQFRDINLFFPKKMFGAGTLSKKQLDFIWGIVDSDYDTKHARFFRNLLQALEKGGRFPHLASLLKALHFSQARKAYDAAIMEPRRKFSKKTLGVAAGVVGGGAVAYLATRKNPYKANLAKYPAADWGHGEVSWEDIRRFSPKEMKKHIGNPEMMCSWVEKFDEYGQQREKEASLKRNFKRLGQKQRKHSMIVQAAALFTRFQFEKWHAALKDFQELQRISRELALSPREREGCIEVVRKFELRQKAKGTRFPYTQQVENLFTTDLDYPIYAKLLIIAKLSEEVMAKCLVKPEYSGWDFFPYLNQDILGSSHFRVRYDEIILMLKMRHKLRPSNSAFEPDCEDISAAAMDVLLDQDYPALGLVMKSSRSGGEGHIVYLVKGGSTRLPAYGFIGFNPLSRFSRPSYGSVRELMRAEFPSYGKCLVVDFSTLIGKRRESKEKAFFTHQGALQHLEDAHSYQDSWKE
tara:strand:- start:2502 stop:4055 length:1554 start_codon:yes stop_codon:yes gene_type:complete